MNYLAYDHVPRPRDRVTWCTLCHAVRMRQTHIALGVVNQISRPRARAALIILVYTEYPTIDVKSVIVIVGRRTGTTNLYQLGACRSMITVCFTHNWSRLLVGYLEGCVVRLVSFTQTFRSFSPFHQPPRPVQHVRRSQPMVEFADVLSSVRSRLAPHSHLAVCHHPSRVHA